MTPKEAAKIIGCSASYVRYLVFTGKIRAKRRLTHTNRYGHLLDISETEAERYKKIKHVRGWPRGKPRKDRQE